MLINQVIDSEMATIEIIDEVVYIALKEDADLDKEKIEEMIELREQLQDYKPMLVLADIRKIWQATKQARQTAASKRMTKLNIAMAILTSTLASRMLANFFIQFNKPVTPTRMFTSKEKALKWLESYR